MILLRYYHTVKYLKLVQITSRIWHRLYRPKPDLRPAPQQSFAPGSWHVNRWRDPVMLGPDLFSYLNVERRLSFPKAWNAEDLDKLWIYNLHYFDDLNAREAENRKAWHIALIQRWIKENPPAYGNGWEPYPLSLRIVNWIKWALSGNNLDVDALQSLAVQARQLRRRLEFHLLGNHLFENAKALVFVGLFFTGEEANEWRQTGERLLREQINEQILLDGGHFELSPMYHSLILEGLLDLKNLYQTFNIKFADSWSDTLVRMIDWLRVMCHPDGGIAFFNDAAFGIAPSLNDLEHYAANLGLVTSTSNNIGTRLLDASGYTRLEQYGAVLIADVAAIGPDYLPGHAHADTLSCELSIHGRRVLVNSGTSLYGVGVERQRQRGTAAHNTVQIDGLNSSEVWSGFRVARRARVEMHLFKMNSGLVLKASHDGYSRLNGEPIHTRSWNIDDHQLEITDFIEGSGNHLVEIYFHFHPNVNLEIKADGEYTILRNEDNLQHELYLDQNVNWELEEGLWHPGFGTSQSNLCLRGCYQGPIPAEFITRFVW